MIKVKELAFVGYPVTDLARARSFYEGVLGLKVGTTFGEGETMWIEYDLGAGTLAITNMSGEWKPTNDGPAAALEVENFAEAIAELKAAEVTITMGPYESPVCWMALIRDPDGNTLCIHRRHDHPAS